LYARLLNCKQTAAAQAAEYKRPINPIAIRLGLAEPDQAHFAVQAGDNPAEHYYGHLLNMAEKLFEAEIDAATFEETLRVMFGTKAYVMFTLDKVVAAIIKQVCRSL
jgi:paired amphipathic helix protein Sin3a